MSRPYPPRNASPSSFVRVNGKIRAREVRVIGPESKQLGIMSLGDALTMARNLGVDLVEIAANATPPVCRLVDFGKFRYEQSKKDKESKKHQHSTRVKEVQLSPKIDQHDLSVKIQHGIGFLCEDMKVKIALKFRGREMAHTEYGFQVIRKYLQEVAPFGHEDFPPKLIGRGITVMISPLPRTKRAKNPYENEVLPEMVDDVDDGDDDDDDESQDDSSTDSNAPIAIDRGGKDEKQPPEGGFTNNPFSQIDPK